MIVLHSKYKEDWRLLAILVISAPVRHHAGIKDGLGAQLLEHPHRAGKFQSELRLHRQR